MKIILIEGPAASGKTTLANEYAEEEKAKGHSVAIIENGPHIECVVEGVKSFKKEFPFVQNVDVIILVREKIVWRGADRCGQENLVQPDILGDALNCGDGVGRP